MKTKVDIFFPNRRIPALIPFKFSQSGPVPLQLVKDVYKEDIAFHDVFGRMVVEDKLAPPAILEKYENKIPFDVYFPSLQDKVMKRTCAICHKYHSSIKSLTSHKRAVHPRGRGGVQNRGGGGGRGPGRGRGKGSGRGIGIFGDESGSDDEEE